MYTIDGLDTVAEIPDAPHPDVGAPLPAVVADEGHLLLAYIVSEPDPAWDPSCPPRIVSPDTEELLLAIVSFQWPYAHMFGPPNDEALDGHPLAVRGLHSYAVYEVHNSSWVRRLERMNAVHPRHDPASFLAGKRHYVFAFHDSTFECIAEGFEVQFGRGSLSDAVALMVGMLANG